MEKLNFGKIGVLMGGPSSEREVSIKSGKAVFESLSREGINVTAIDIKTDAREDNIQLMKSHSISLAFIALHGRFGEDGQMQEILDSLDISYTGSGVQASRLAMDKIASRKIFESAGLNVPRYKVQERLFCCPGGKFGSDNFAFPLVVKPATGGSSIGLSIVDKEEYLDKSIELAFNFDERIIIEEYIKGRELTVGILDEKPLSVIEIIPKNKFFDYEAKYQTGMTEYVVPAELEDKTAKRLQATALSAHKLLGCYGCSRVDMILDSNNIPFVLEVNTIPGLTKTSLLPKAAKVAGIDFSQLCIKLIQLANEKKQVKLSS